jgi:hypothetical protein
MKGKLSTRIGVAVLVAFVAAIMVVSMLIFAGCYSVFGSELPPTEPRCICVKDCCLVCEPGEE